MREVSFLEKLVFDFNGNIAKNALIVGDVDNDQRNELLCANLQGDLAIFKGRSSTCWAQASNLGMVTACAIGDITNVGKNHVIAINTEGWLYIFDTDIVKIGSRSESTTASTAALSDTTEQPPNIAAVSNSNNESSSSKIHNSNHKSSIISDQSSELFDQSDKKEGQSKHSQNNLATRELIPYYEQRMPANARVMLLADLDGDKLIELIIGLTDRVLRTYRWIKIGENKGKFVGVYKWEFADQIGAVSLNPSRHEGCQDIIVAQPGGTYAKLECIEKKSSDNHAPQQSDFNDNSTGADNIAKGDNRIYNDDDNVQTDYASKLTPEYHQLSLTQMRNPHISTEILGGIRGSTLTGNNMKKSKGISSPNADSDNECTSKTTNIDASEGQSHWSSSLIVVSTLDGTLMLVNKDEVLWSIQVDHQLFALDKLEVPIASSQTYSDTTDATTGPSTCKENAPLDTNNDQIEQYLVACAWDGKTYIVDKDRNYLRFKFSEAVSSFAAENYYFDDRHHASLVYATFNNQIILYYDIELTNIKPKYLLSEIMNNPQHRQLYQDVCKFVKFNIDSNTGADGNTCDDIRPSSRDLSTDYDYIKWTLHDILYQWLPDLSEFD